MNRTNLEHAVFALIMQLIIGLLTNNWWAGAAFGSAFFIGREHTQREYHIGDPSKLEPWVAFDIWRWSNDAKFDLLCPVFTCLAVACFVEYRFKWL